MRSLTIALSALGVPRFLDIKLAERARDRAWPPVADRLTPSISTTGSTKAEAAVMNASRAASASATVKGRSSRLTPSVAASLSTARRVTPGRMWWPSGWVRITPSRSRMKAEDEVPSVTQPSSTIQAS